MSMPSPFIVSREIAENIGGAFQRVKEESAIDRILSEASQSGNPEDYQNAIGKIISQVSPERRGDAIALLQGKAEAIKAKQTRARQEQAAQQYGYPVDAPPAVQKSILENAAADKRAANILGTSSDGLPSSGEVAPSSITGNTSLKQTPSAQKPKTISDLTDDQLVALTGIKGYSEPAKAELQRRQKNAELIDKSYEAQKDFIDSTTMQYQSFESDMKPRLLQMQKLASDEELISPAAAQFLEALDIPLGILENPGNELYSKLSQDLLKGLPDTYGNRILKVEVENFLKTIPQLINSPNGRRMIASNMLKLGEIKEAFYKEMRNQQMNLLDSNQKFPKDFQQRVFDNVKPQLDRLNQEFVQLSEIRDVPRGTVPFFNPQGGISFVPNNPEALEWASQNGGKRVW